MHHRVSACAVHSHRVGHGIIVVDPRTTQSINPPGLCAIGCQGQPAVVPVRACKVVLTHTTSGFAQRRNRGQIISMSENSGVPEWSIRSVRSRRHGAERLGTSDNLRFVRHGVVTPTVEEAFLRLMWMLHTSTQIDFIICEVT